MSQVKVIINPFARGGVTGKRWPHISELLKDAGLSFDYVFTEGVGHGIELAREAAWQGYELVIAVGGDGTVNEVVNGLVDETGKGRATLGIISMGTCGDSVRTLGIPRDYAQACRLLSNFKRATIDLGVVEYMIGGERVRRFFINTAGLGFDAAVVERQKGFPKIIKGTLPYVICVMLTLGGYRDKQVTLDVEGAKEEQRVFSVIVSNGRYFGGGMKVAPDANLCDGLLDVIVIGDMGKPSFLWSFPRVYRGTHITHPKVRVCQAKSIEVQSGQRLLLQADGELLGEAPASFQVLPAALAVAI
ncbi:MAG: diacylglycerol/lipid kinase family protein [Dehalococcoidia bacterium]